MPPFDRLRAAQSAVEGPERPFGCFAQNTPVPFLAKNAEVVHQRPPPAANRRKKRAADASRTQAAPTLGWDALVIGNPRRKIYRKWR